VGEKTIHADLDKGEHTVTVLCASYV